MKLLELLLIEETINSVGLKLILKMKHKMILV